MTPQQAADKLIGTCDSGEEIESFTLAQCAEFDLLAYCCVCCGWWFSQHEEPANEGAGGWLCDDCARGG